MPSSSVHTFTDPDEYAEAIRQGTVQLTIKTRGTFSAKRTRIDFHRLWMQRLEEALPQTLHVDGWGGRAILLFRTKPGPSLIRRGVELDETAVLRLRPGQSFYQHTAGPTSYGGMSLPVEELTAVGGAFAGCDLKPPDRDLFVTPSADAIAKLRRLHEAAETLAKDAPEILARPETARALEQALIAAMIDCLSSDGTDQDRTALRQHAAIMRRFHRVIEENADQPLYLTELCGLVGASERTLQASCQEHLGMGPKRFLLLRRMHLVRRALRESTPLTTTVTEIATRYGFWQFGRLSVEYKTLFGESPSTTLARQT